MVEVSDVHRWFGSVHAVRGVSLRLHSGQVAGLLGHNGAGKSTTMRMIAGTLAPDEGEVVIGGVRVRDDRARAAAQIGYLPEHTPLYPEMTVIGYLRYRAGVHGLRGRAGRDGAERVIERCWLRDVRTRALGALSKGYKQRVGLAAALLHDPAVLLLDEPTSGLDPTQVRETRRLIGELREGRTMLISSHILPEVEVLCDRVVIVAGGKVRADGDVAELAGRLGTAELRCEVDAGSDDRAERARVLVATLAGVLSARAQRSEDGWTRIDAALDAGRGADVREDAARQLSRAGFLVRELTTRRGTLEEVFVRVMERAAQEAEGVQNGAASIGGTAA